MALGGNPGSALAAYGKRKEQIERWQRSDTAKQPTEIKDRPKRVNFEDKCIFLAASSAGEKNKVARMLRDGYNINEVDGDGITALHQACIEDNIEMVEFLLDHGADVNISDNEGWTPLHAVASCNFTSIAKVLLEHGANSAALNNDCSLPIDICKNDDIKDLLRADLASKAIDVGAARKAEEAAMIEHVKEWLVNGYCEIPHSTTGATAMHVAACKGYIKVLDKLIKAGADINAVDGDGWTPLHAAAHWGQLEACRVLLEAECDTSIANNCDQDAVEVADLSVVSLLEPYKKPRKRDATVVKYLPLPPPPKKKALKSRSMFDERITTNINLSPKKDVPSNKPTATNTTTSLLKADKDEEEHGEAEDTVSDLPSSSLDQIPVDSSHPTSPPLPCPDTATLSSLHSTKSDDDNTQTPDGVTLRRHQRDKTFTRNLNSDVFLKTKDAASAGFGENRRKLGEGDKVSSSLPSLSSSNVATGSSSVATSTKTDYLKTNDGGASGDTEEGVPAWRRGGSLRTRTTQPTTSTLPEEDQATTGDKAAVRRTKSEVSPEVSLRRAYSFESDTKFYFRLHEARERLRAIEAVSAAMNANLPDIYSLGGKEGKVKDVPATPPPTAKEPESVTSTAPKVKPTPVIFTPVTTLTTPTVPTLTTPTVPTTLQRAHTVPAPSTSSQGQGPDLTPRARRKYIEEAESERLFNNATNPASPDYNPEIVLRRRDSDTNVRTARPTTISTTSPTTATRPLPGHPFLRSGEGESSSSSPSVATTPSTPSPTSAPSTTTTTKIGPVSKFKQFLIKSFVPPARDEESETQRKAHAKRVRETRRSTQGVTLEELKSAEQYVKAQQSTDSTVPDTIQESASASSPTTVPVSSSSHAAPGNVTSTGMLRKEDDSLERRPSWRLRVDDTDPSKFSLEDLRSTGTTATHSQSAESKSRLESPATSDPKYSPVIRTRRHELRNSRPPRPPEEEDTNLVKEESAEAKTGAQGVIAKKKKPKRRSTGVLNYSSTWTDDLDGPQTLSDTESSRRGSDDGGASTGQDSPKSENGIAGKVNYKKLYEETLKENQQLKGKVSTLEEEVNQLKISLERMSISTRLGGDAVDMREKRALELKFQEMEEELKKARTLQSDNKKLKDENGALIRVISKLSK